MTRQGEYAEEPGEYAEETGEYREETGNQARLVLSTAAYMVGPPQELRQPRADAAEDAGAGRGRAVPREGRRLEHPAVGQQKVRHHGAARHHGGGHGGVVQGGEGRVQRQLRGVGLDGGHRACGHCHMTIKSKAQQEGGREE